MENTFEVRLIIDWLVTYPDIGALDLVIGLSQVQIPLVIRVDSCTIIREGVKKQIFNGHADRRGGEGGGGGTTPPP